MAQIADLGTRIELVSMDPHCHDISIGLYEQGAADGAPVFLVHSYSGQAGTVERLAFVTRAMMALGGMAAAPGGAQRLRFACGSAHRLACRRVFLEACKVKPETSPEARPLSIYDKTSGRSIRVEGSGGGAYRLGADGADDGRQRRVAAVAAGLVKLGEMRTIGDNGDGVAFACGHAHDALVGLLLVRALNVRATMREQEAVAGRGVLAAPSAQSS